MVQIMNESTAGGRLGTAFGEGISRGLSGLAELKMHQMKQAQVAKGLKAMGLSDDKVGALSQLDPMTLNTYLKQVLQEPQNALFESRMQEMLGGGQPQQQQPQFQPSYPAQGNTQPIMQSAQLPMQQNAPGSPQVSAMPNNPIQRGAVYPMDKNAQMAAAQKPIMIPGEKSPTGQPRGNGLFMDEEEEDRAARQPYGIRQPTRMAGPDLLPYPNIAGLRRNDKIEVLRAWQLENKQRQKMWQDEQNRSLKERALMSRQELKQMGIEAAEKKLEKQQTFGEKQEARKAAMPIMKDIVARHKSTSEQLRMLKEMQQLSDQPFALGFAPMNAIAGFAKKWGLDMTGTLPEQAQAYQKFSSQLAMEKLGALKGRGSDKDLMTIQESVPNLMMSEEGRKLVTKKTMEAAKLGLLELPAMKDVLKENNNIPTQTFAIDVEERYDKMRKEKIKKWAAGYKKKIAELREKKEMEDLAATQDPRTGAYNLAGKRPLETINFSTDTGI